MPNSQVELNGRPAGTRADIIEEVDFTRTFTYFEDYEIAKRFAEIGIEPIEYLLPNNLMVSDWGGGTGTLLSAVTKALSARGHQVCPLVVDLNPTLLSHAKDRGLGTLETDLQTVKIDPPQHLIIMRGSLQYNDLPAQMEILTNANDSLDPKGVMVVQLSSGSPENIALRRIILDHPMLGEVYGSGNRHYTTENQHIDLCQQAGFEYNYVLPQKAPPLHWTPEQMWQRRNAHKLKQALKGGDQQTVATLEAHHQQFLEETKNMIKTAIEQARASNTLDQLGVHRGKNGEYIIEVSYPIIISSRTEIPYLTQDSS